MFIWFLRILVVLVGGLVGWLLPGLLGVGETSAQFVWPMMGMAGAMLVVGLESVLTRQYSALVPTVVLGLVFGLFVAQALSFVPDAIVARFDTVQVSAELRRMAEGMLRATFFALFSYLGIALFLRAQPAFRLITPFLDFVRKQARTPQPLILDTSVIIDGRIADISETGLIDNALVIPKFVLQELQDIADSPDKLKRSRGRHGLEMLNRLQRNDQVDIEVNDSIIPSVGGVDNKLVRLAKRLDGKIVTNDYNLSKIAQLQGVSVVNVNDLAGALRPVVLPGEEIGLKIIKAGEEAGQGVGYLDDGTMVVVENARENIGMEMRVLVTSVFQTSAGKMLFGKVKEE